MYKILISLLLSAALAGCAATDYKNARVKANEVQNGMTVAQAAAILGLPPTHQGADFVEWRRGHAQKYTGNANGAIRYELREGKVVNVPEGGIFSEAARQKINADWLAARQAEDAARLAEEEAAEKARARRQEEMLEAARLAAARAKEEMAAEAKALANARYTCLDKAMCGKVFSLAQIYLAEHSDQKIQVVTDTIVQTYNPTDAGKIGMSIIKVPGKGTRESVEITASCKDDDYLTYASTCRRKRTMIYNGFRSFVDARLQK